MRLSRLCFGEVLHGRSTDGQGRSDRDRRYRGGRAAQYHVSRHLSNGHYVLATIAGKMRRFRIRVLAGDRVTLAVSPYDLTRGRITFRHK